MYSIMYLSTFFIHPLYHIYIFPPLWKSGKQCNWIYSYSKKVLQLTTWQRSKMIMWRVICTFILARFRRKCYFWILSFWIYVSEFNFRVQNWSNSTFFVNFDIENTGIYRLLLYHISHRTESNIPRSNLNFLFGRRKEYIFIGNHKCLFEIAAFLFWSILSSKWL